MPRTTAPRRGLSVLIALVLAIAAAGCATIASLNAAGNELQDHGYEVHDLLMEQDARVTADVERSDAAAEPEHFEEVASILWRHLEGDAAQAEIRIRTDDEADRIESYTAEELEAAERP